VIVVGGVLVPVAVLLARARRVQADAAFNEYVFFPPIDRWPDTLWLGSFRKLFEAGPACAGRSTSGSTS
jgi:hypothetical protein